MEKEKDKKPKKTAGVKKTTKRDSQKKTIEKKETVSKKENESIKKIEIKKEPKNNKKLIILILSIVGGVILLGLIIALAVKSTGPRVKIVKSENKKVEYEDYNNNLISMKIPKGWKVEVAPVDYIHYSFKVYNPKNPTYMILFALKQEGFLKTEKARKAYARYYPDTAFAKLTPIDPQTTEAYYKVWNSNAKLANKLDVGYEYLPYFNNFEVIDNLGKNILGGDILRATFTDANGKTAQGLFTASVTSVGSYYMNVDIFNIFSEKVDVFPLNVYNIIVMSAPDEEFNNWQSVLDYCLSTLQFSDTFVNGFNSEEAKLMQTIKANQQVYNEISDMIMDSWEKRNNSYDVISQKQSDATLGYERVYDTDTGEIYKAYNGFTDDYKGDKYKPISDSQYTEAISGYIEK